VVEYHRIRERPRESQSIGGISNTISGVFYGAEMWDISSRFPRFSALLKQLNRYSAGAGKRVSGRKQEDLQQFLFETNKHETAAATAGYISRPLSTLDILPYPVYLPFLIPRFRNAGKPAAAAAAAAAATAAAAPVLLPLAGLH